MPNSLVSGSNPISAAQWRLLKPLVPKPVDGHLNVRPSTTAKIKERGAGRVINPIQVLRNRLLAYA